MTNPNWKWELVGTVTGSFKDAVKAVPDKILVDFLGDTLTYREADELSNALANNLAELGIGKGDMVASLLENSHDALLTWIAVNKLGAVYAPINTANKGEFLRHPLDNCEASVIILENDFVSRIETIASGLTHLKHIVYRGEKPEHSLTEQQLLFLDDLKKGNTAAIDVEVKPQDLSLLIYTSGTTGPSKACMITHNHISNSARQVLVASGRTPEEIHWTCLPAFHLNALGSTFLSSIMACGSIAMFPRFSVSRFWADIERSKASVVSLLGTMLPLIAHAPDSPEMERCKGQIRLLRGGPLSAEVKQIWHDRFGVKHVGSNNYGITEATPVTSISHGDTPPPGSSGRDYGPFEIMIVDDEDREVPRGEAGEIVVRPRKPHIMFEGYYKNPEATLGMWRNGWFHMGDIGKLDEDGWFYFLDRKKDYLRRGGENISSLEMEKTFTNHEAIRDVAVHAVLSELSEDEVKVTAVLEEGAVLTEKELAEWAVDHLPYFAMPRYIEFREELPKNPVGRVLKYVLRDEGRTANTWDLKESDVSYERR